MWWAPVFRILKQSLKLKCVILCNHYNHHFKKNGISSINTFEMSNLFWWCAPIYYATSWVYCMRKHGGPQCWTARFFITFGSYKWLLILLIVKKNHRVLIKYSSVILQSQRCRTGIVLEGWKTKAKFMKFIVSSMQSVHGVLSLLVKYSHYMHA